MLNVIRTLYFIAIWYHCTDHLMDDHSSFRILWKPYNKCLYHLSPFRNFLKFWLKINRPPALAPFRLLTRVILNFVLRRCPVHPARKPCHTAYPVVPFLVWCFPQTAWISILFYFFLQGRFVSVASQVSCVHFSRCLALFYPHIHSFFTLLGLILVVLLFFFFSDTAFSLREFPTTFFPVLLKPPYLGRVFCKGVSVLVVFPMGLFCFGLFFSNTTASLRCFRLFFPLLSVPAVLVFSESGWGDQKFQAKSRVT